MLPSYESPLRFQEGWSSLQTHSRTPRNPPRGLTLQMGMLGNLKARTALRMCSKNLQLTPNCGTWANSPWRNPFFLSDGSDNGDSGSFEMDEAAEAKNKGLCYRCTSGSA